MNVTQLRPPRERLDPPKPKARPKKEANRTNLTEEKVANLRGKARGYYVWDGGGRDCVRGLHIHVQPTATKTYRYSFRFKGAKQAVSYKLGRWPGMSLTQAREAAVAAARLVAMGRDPRQADPARSSEFGAVLQAWTKVQRRQHISADINHKFLIRIFADLTHRPIAEIGRLEVSTILAKVVDSGRAPTANRAHAHLKAFYNWCVDEGYVQVSPVKRKAPGPKSQPRQRTWFSGDAADQFIKDLWTYASNIGGNEGKYLKLCLILGKRRNIIEGMQWGAISDAWYWTPPKGSKNKRNNAVPLPKLAQRVLGRRSSDGGYVLGSSLSNLANEISRGVKQRVEPTFFLHGLRHVVITKMAELKVPRDVARLVTDHAQPNDAHSGYEHNVDWTPEMLEALERWCAHIERLVAPSQAVAVLR